MITNSVAAVSVMNSRRNQQQQTGQNWSSSLHSRGSYNNQAGDDEPENESHIQTVNFTSHHHQHLQYATLPVTSLPLHDTNPTETQIASRPRWSADRWKRITYVLNIVLSLVASAGMICASITYSIADNHGQGSFWAFVPVHISILLFFISMNKRSDGKPWNIAACCCVALAVFLLLVGAVVDGVHANHLKATDFSRCSYSTEASLRCIRPKWYYWQAQTTASIDICSLEVKPGTCYCCYIFHEVECDSASFSSKPYIYESVISCDQVEHKYQSFLWGSTVFSAVTFVLLMGLTTSASQFYYAINRTGTSQSRPSWITYPGNVPNLVNQERAFYTCQSGQLQGDIYPAPAYEAVVMNDRPPVYRSQWLNEKPPDYTP